MGNHAELLAFLVANSQMNLSFFNDDLCPNVLKPGQCLCSKPADVKLETHEHDGHCPDILIDLVHAGFDDNKDAAFDLAEGKGADIVVVNP